VFYDGVEAREDPNLAISAYYARLNLLNELLSPVAAETLDLSWKHAGEREMKEMRRSATVGAIVSDLIRALGIREISSGGMAPGQWFVHSGPTYFTRQGYERKQATIKLGDGRSITGIVRKDCEITGTADANMDGRDEASFILGRLQTDSKFDLVVAGNRRDPLLGAFLAQPDVRSISLASPLGNVIDLIDYDSGTQPGDEIFRINGFGDKKDYDQRRLIHGLARQLPSYLHAAGAQAGTYAVMCHEHDPRTVKEWLDPVRESTQPAERVLLDLEIIDCRPQESASRKR
jgi:hypothetical protein